MAAMMRATVAAALAVCAATLPAQDMPKPEIIETSTLSDLKKTGMYVKLANVTGFFLWQPVMIDNEPAFIIGLCNDNSVMLSNESNTKYGVQLPHKKGAAIRSLRLPPDWKKGVKPADCSGEEPCAYDCGKGECVDAANYLFGMDDEDVCVQAKKTGMCNHTAVAAVCWESCKVTEEKCIEKAGTTGGCHADDNAAVTSLLKRIKETPNSEGCANVEDMCDNPAVSCLCAQMCSKIQTFKPSPAPTPDPSAPMFFKGTYNMGASSETRKKAVEKTAEQVSMQA